MKQITTFTVISAGGVDRVGFTYDEINDAGDITAANNKESFVAVDKTLVKHIEAIREFIRVNRME